MNKELIAATEELIVFLRKTPKDALNDPELTKAPAYTRWLSCAYNDPDFFMHRGYFTVYGKAKLQPIDTLSSLQVQAYITFLVRQMRFSYVPYPCIVDGLLLALLERWLHFEKEKIS